MNEYEDYDILDEYVDVTNKIKEIQEILNRYREEIKQKLSKTKSENKKQDIIAEFQIKMRHIKKSKLITSRYKKLKKRQSEIRLMLLPDNDSDSTLYSDSNSDSDLPKNEESILSFLENIKNNITE